MEKGVAAKGKVKRIGSWIGVGVLTLLGVLLIALVLILNVIVTPRRITPVILNLANEYVDGKVECESIDITFFSTFPDLGVKLLKGSVSQTDTLVSFESCIVAVNPMAFLLEKKVVVHQLEIKDADIYAHVDTLGKANWDIFVLSEEETLEDTTRMEPLDLNIKNIRFQNVNITYDDWQEDVFVMVDSLNLRLKGNLSKEYADLSLGVRTSGITSSLQGQTFTKNLPVSFRTQLGRDRIAKTIAIERGNVTVGSLELKTSGMVKSSDIPGVMDVDIDFSLDATSLNDLLAMIPEHISDVSTKLVAGGKIETKGKLSGPVGQEQYPVVSLSLELIDGTLASVKHINKPFLEHFDVNFYTLLDFSHEQKSSLNLDKFYLQTSSSRLSAKGKFDNILSKPFIDLHADADINFTQLAQYLPFQEDMQMEGIVDLDLSVKCLLDDILLSNYGKIDANGKAVIKDVVFRDRKEELSFYTSNANMVFGSNTKDSIRGELRESLLRGNMALDSLSLKWKDELTADVGKMTMRFSTSAPQDTNAIVPVATGISAENMRLVMGDSVRVRAVKTRGSVRLQPGKELQDLPEISVRLSLDSLRGKAFDLAGRVEAAKVNLKLTKQQARRRNAWVENRMQKDSTLVTTRTSERRGAGRDSTLTRSQRDSIRQSRLDPNTNLTFQLESKEAKNLLRNWEFGGGFESKDLSLRTPYFPLPVRMEESDMTFTSNTLSLKQAHVHMGASDFKLKGEVEGLRNAALYNGKVIAKMTLTSDTLDFNELIRAAVAGSDYSQKSTAEREDIAESVWDESNLLQEEDTTSMGIFVVPRNLDLEFNSRIKNARYGKIAIHNTRGRIILRDQALYLPRFSLNTDVGSANMTMVYKAPNIQGAHLGVELNMKSVDIKELIDALPVIDDLTPMLRSFEGVVDCDITAVTELDSLMNVRMPETTASCYMSGKNLVLLDGETFAEISKMLMFKNKKRNLIDSLSVEMILEDEKLMIFPFKVSMDRYTAAVGGLQNLDMTFDYHITVLKSPIPFKLGVNVSGIPDKMKIRLGKAKYKNMFATAREERLDNTIVNLRKEMDSRLRESIHEIVGAELTQPVRRPRSAISDSLRNEFFQLEDTLATSAVDMKLLPDSIQVSELPDQRPE